MAEERFGINITEMPAAQFRPLRIGIVSQYYWPEAFRIIDLAEGMVERGHKVTVLTGMPNYPSGTIYKGYGWRGPYRQQRRGVSIHRAPLWPRGQKSKLGLVANYASFAVTASVLALWTFRRKHDVIFVYEPSPVTVGFPGIVAGMIARAPVYFWALDLWPESVAATGLVRSPGLLKVAAWLARRVYRNSDVLLSPSKGFVPKILETAGAPVDVRYFPQWAGENPRTDAGATDLKTPDMPDGFRIMFTGNIGVSQDFDTVLAAAAITRADPAIQWIIVGEGHDLPRIRQNAATMGLSDCVHFLSQHPAELMPAMFAKADVLFATLRDEPAFELTVPAKIQSYLAAAKPVVTAINGEVADIISTSGAGIAVAAGDAKALAEVVMRLRAMTDSERATYGQKGRALFEAEFERSKLFDRLESWFAGATGGGKEGH